MLKFGLTTLFLIAGLTTASFSYAEKQKTASQPANITPNNTSNIVPNNIVPINIAPAFLNYLAGLIAESEGDINMAALAFAQAEIADPKNSFIQEKNFSFQLAKGNMPETFRLAKKLSQHDNTLPLVFIVSAIEHIKEGNLSQVKKELNKAQESSPTLLQFKLLEAYLDLATGKDIDTVVKSIREFKNVAAFAGQSHYHLGRIFEQQGKLSDAELEYKVAYELDPMSIYPVIRLGAIYSNSNQKNKAKELYLNFVKSNQSSIMLRSTIKNLDNNKVPLLLRPNLKDNWAEVLFGFSTMMAAQNIDLAANHLLNMVVAIKPNYEFSNFYFALLAERLGNTAKAKKYYSKISKTNKTWLNAQIRLSDIAFKEGKEKQAIRTITNLANNHPNIAIFKRIVAEMYYNTGQYKKAIKQYDRIISSINIPNKRDSITYFARGASYERLANYPSAEDDMKKSLELNPNNAVVLNYLGYMWVEQGQNLEQGFNYIRKALVLKPGDGAIMDSLGWAWFKQGEIEKAILFLEKAIQIIPDDPTVNDHLGDAYHAIGRDMEASAQWKHALTLNHNDEALEADLRRKLANNLRAKK